MICAIISPTGPWPLRICDSIAGTFVGYPAIAPGIAGVGGAVIGVSDAVTLSDDETIGAESPRLSSSFLRLRPNI